MGAQRLVVVIADGANVCNDDNKKKIVDKRSSTGARMHLIIP